MLRIYPEVADKVLYAINVAVIVFTAHTRWYIAHMRYTRNFERFFRA